MTLKQLMDLGAPTLASGYFYRVRTNALGLGYVQIRRHRRGWKSELLVERRVHRDTSWLETGPARELSAEEGIVNACVRAKDEVEKILDERDYWAAFRRWEGDHDHDWRTK